MRLTPADKITKVRELWRRAPRRWRQAIMVALAIALPGSITAGATAGMLPMGGSSDAVLDGILAAQDDAALGGFLDPELLEAVPVGASSVAEPVRAVLSSEEVIETLGESGIPTVAVDAYMQAADQLAVDDPTCGIRWTLLAAIGRVESNHGRFGGAQLRDDGYGTKPIRGIPLDGRPNVALIRDTDAWRARRRHHLRPGRGADAVHPLDVEVGRRRRQRRRAARPQQHLRRRPGRRRLPVPGRRRPARRRRQGARRSGATTTPTSTSEWCSTWPRCTSRARSISCPRSAFRPASPRPGRGRRPPRR